MLHLHTRKTKAINFNNFSDDAEDRAGLQSLLRTQIDHLEVRLAVTFKLFSLHCEGLSPPSRSDFIHELGVISLPEDSEEEVFYDDEDDDINNQWDLIL